SLSRHALAGPIPVFSCFFADLESSIPVSRSQAHTPPRSRGAFLRPGFATLLHRPRTRGGRSAGPPNVVHPRAAQCNELAEKYLQHPHISQKPCTAVQPRALTRNRTKCRSICGSDRMLVVRSGSRAEVEKKA